MSDLQALARRVIERPLLAPKDPEVIRRRANRLRRRRRTFGGATIVLTAAVVVAVVMVPGGSASQQVATGSGATPGPQLTLPAVTPAPGAKSFDFGYVRLWLPPAWSTTNAQDLRPSCHPGSISYHDQVFSPLYPGPFRPCPAAVHGDWVLILPAPKTTLLGATRTKINGITAWASPARPNGATRYDLPSLHTAITVLGPAAHKLLGTLQPSALAAVLEARYPTVIPKQWRRVDYHGISAAVPSTWPLKPVGSSLPPGACGRPFPTPPAVYTGNSTAGAADCGSQPIELVTIPADGLWLHPVAPNDFPGEPREPIHVTHGTAQLIYWPGGDGYADALDLLITLHGHRVDAGIGLGVDPSIAEAIISSLGVTGSLHAEL
ncbi:MAG: hypothetical protein ACYDEN_08255 [Acidimicrobiales bacterium]